MNFWDSHLYIWIGLPLLVFFARVIDVTLGTLRIIFISRGKKYLAPLLGFVEVFIWIAVVAQAGPRNNDQYNFTDPDSRIMKNSTHDGFDQHYNVQAAVDQESMLIVAGSLSNHANDKQEAEPTLEALDPALGKPKAGALDNGYWSDANRQAFEKRGIEAYIATAGREAHHQSWQSFFAKAPTPPAEDASPIVKMAYKLQTEIGKAISPTGC